MFRSDVTPIVGKEDNFAWRKKFLQCPATGEPATFTELGLMQSRILGAGDVGQVGIAYGSLTVPAKHGVDGLGELGARRLVDATGIYPDVVEVVLSSLGAATGAFLVRSPPLQQPQIATHFLESYLLMSPGVRQVCVRGNSFSPEVLLLKSPRVEETHRNTRQRPNLGRLSW